MNKIDLSDTKLRNLPQLLKTQAATNGDHLFLVDHQSQITFAQADRLSSNIATSLIELGVKPGDNVALYLENRAETVLLALAINKISAIWVPINTDYKGQWLANTLTDSEPKVLITQASFMLKSKEIIESSGIRNTVVLDTDEQSYAALTDSPPFKVDYAAIDYGDTSAIMWTSGTTGKSKGVMVSHNNWLRPIIQGTSVLYSSEPGDVIMNVLPMYHAAAWNTAILRALVEGITVVIEKRFSVSNFWQRVNQHGVTQAFTLGAMHMFLWNAPPSEQDKNNSLRRLQAVPIPPDIASPFEQRFDLTLLGTGYGQSECMMLISEAGHNKPAPPHSMGYATADVEIKLFNEQNEEVPLGDVGEIRVRPLEQHIICNGYFNNPTATQEAWINGWFCTGDMARSDASQAYYFSDRKKDAVRYGGRNISTLEVESVVRKHPAIADLAVYGLPCPELDAEDELSLAVVLKQSHSVSAEQLARFINDNAPHYFVPRYIHFTDSLPYTPTNKIQKFKLREQGVPFNAWDRTQTDFKLERA